MSADNSTTRVTGRMDQTRITVENAMKETACDLWLEAADYRCLLISGARTGDGAAIMDSRSAAEAKDRFHAIEYDLGRLLASRGNHVHELRPGVLCFPVKQFQWSAVSLEIVARSANELAAIVGEAKTLLPRPVSDSDAVSWEDAAKALAVLPDNVWVIQHA